MTLAARLVVLLSLFVIAPPVSAAPKKRPTTKAEPVVKKSDEPPSEDDQRAKKLFEDGTRAFNLGEFPNAVDLYRQAYNLKPEPGLLYNIAQSYRLSNDPSNAVFFYRSFLRAAPNTPNRKEIEGRIKKLELQIAEQKAPPNSPVGLGALPPGEEPTGSTESKPTGSSTTTPTTLTNPTPTTSNASANTLVASPATAKPLHKKWWLWTIVGVAAVGVGLGVGLGIGLQDRAPSAHFGTKPVF